MMGRKERKRWREREKGAISDEGEGVTWKGRRVTKKSGVSTLKEWRERERDRQTDKQTQCDKRSGFESREGKKER